MDSFEVSDVAFSEGFAFADEVNDAKYEDEVDEERESKGKAVTVTCGW